MASLLDGFIDAVSGAEAGLVALCVVMPLENRTSHPFPPSSPPHVTPPAPIPQPATSAALSLGWAGAQ